MLQRLMRRVAPSGTQEEKPRDYLLLVTEGIAESLQVREFTAEYVRAGGADYPRDDLLEVIQVNGGRLFIANVALPARVEAENVRKLRDNAIMSSLFSDDGPDARRMPWQLWALILALVVGLVIVGARH